ncbi:hypothetical protein BH09MYX1_BH09MYX1_10240 [soil metagenome]
MLRKIGPRAALAKKVIALAVALATFLAIFAWSPTASAYPWMVRKGYTSCNVCHADPSGGNLLTPYGRALGVTEMAMKYKKGDDDPGTVGDFFFGAFKMPEPLLLGADIRSLGLFSFTGGPVRTHLYLMQADFEGQLTLGRFRVNGNLGFAHEGAVKASITRGNADLENRLISRTFWAGVDIGKDKEVLLRGGRMNLPFGLRSIEHTSWVRKTTRTDINDGQQYGLALSLNLEKVRAEIMGIAGNFAIRPDSYRERGYSAYFEYAPSSSVAIGGSSLITHADQDLDNNLPTWRQAHGLFGRVAFTKAIGLLAEADFLFKSSKDEATNAITNQFGSAALVQLDMEPVQGLHFLVTGEAKNTDVKNLGSGVGAWASIWWFFLPHMDVRIDGIIRSEDPGAGAGRQSSGLLLLQAHLYL